MELESLLKFFSDYGVALVITGIFLAAIIKALGLLFKYLEKKLSHKTHDNHLDMRDKVTDKIQSLINDALKKMGCRRIQVIEFSNSITSIASLPFRYMTCTYEACPHELSPTARFIDRLPTSLFSQLFSRLKRAKFYEASKIEFEEEHTNSLMLDLMDKCGGEVFLFTLMRSMRGKPVGLLVFEKDEKFSEADKDDALSLSKRLTSLLCILDK